ncbi:MAG: outer membrane beta-barrel protein [Bryobacteraceae bacterium]
MKPVALFALALAPMMAQSPYRKHFISVGAGAGVPGAEVSRYLDSSPLFRVAYGYRFARNFQADVGFDTVFHAAKIRDFYESDFGDLRIKDYQFMLPLGGRAVIPIGRVLLSAGGGGAYMRYQERVRQPFGNNFRIDCPVCRERSGWGYYGLLGLSVALDRYEHFRLGVTTRVYRGRTEGDAFGSLPAIRTRDTWVNTAGEFTFSF